MLQRGKCVLGRTVWQRSIVDHVQGIICHHGALQNTRVSIHARGGGTMWKCTENCIAVRSNEPYVHPIVWLYLKIIVQIKKARNWMGYIASHHWNKTYLQETTHFTKIHAHWSDHTLEWLPLHGGEWELALREKRSKRVKAREGPCLDQLWWYTMNWEELEAKPLHLRSQINPNSRKGGRERGSEEEDIRFQEKHLISRAWRIVSVQ